MISLRGHHLICLQTFVGRGYDEGFVSNLERIVQDLHAHPDQEVTLLANCDSVCCSCPSNSGGTCHSGGAPAEERLSHRDRLVLDAIGVAPGTILPYSVANQQVCGLLRRDPELKEVCGGCEWWDLCQKRLPDGATRLRVLCIGPWYHLAPKLEECKAHKYFAHLLYGVTEFSALGAACVFPPVTASRSWMKKRIFRSTLGDLPTEIWALWHTREYDVVYATNDSTIRLLTYLKRLGWYKKPVVALMHHLADPCDASWAYRVWKRFSLAGIDRLGCLSSKIFSFLHHYDPALEAKAEVVLMGPEVTSTAQEAAEPPYVITVGKTNRDFPLVLKAMENLPYELVIVAPSSLLPEQLPGNVRHMGDWRPADELRKLYAGASAVLVPVKETTPDGVYGLSSLADALGMGKPVIVTRTPGLAYPVEEWGCGLTVAPGDVEGLRRAIQLVCTDANRRDEMQRAARTVTSRLNVRTMAEQILRLARELTIVTKESGVQR